MISILDTLPDEKASYYSSPPKPTVATGNIGPFAPVIPATSTTPLHTDFATDSEYPSYCEANPCESNGNNLITATTVRVAMNGNTSAPIGIVVEDNALIAYVPGDGSTSGIDGHAILGWGFELDWPRARNFS